MTKVLLGLLLVLIANIQYYNDEGNKDQMIQRTDTPIADLDALATTICGRTRAQILNNLTIITSFKWTFPGGTPASNTEAKPLIQYQMAVTYDTTLTAINTHTENTLTREIFISVVDKAP